MIRQLSIILVFLLSLISIQAQHSQATRLYPVKYIHVPSIGGTPAPFQATPETTLDFELTSMIVSEEVELHFEHPTADFELRIINYQGKSVFYEQFTNDYKTKVIINVEHLQHGAYTLQLKTQGQTHTKKIVKV